ncbi:hypothetical protein TSUD_224220 [Trifolium subterraneum]|uniref:Uncharacterized protein n=1 Tax=Trifolium subterraneum TaxID=3900 RepID=A0A2Z6M285_TRISU|nr:hypothetical protein TSUD_224220 [Trifolium subterraneum]
MAFKPFVSLHLLVTTVTKRFVTVFDELKPPTTVVLPDKKSQSKLARTFPIGFPLLCSVHRRIA